MLSSVIITFLVKIIAEKKKIIDIPNVRSSHSTPTPRGGGLAIVISWYAGITILFMNNLMDDNLFYALLSGIILASISILDDIFSLSPKLRFVFQIISIITALYFVGLPDSINFGVFSIKSNIVLSVLIGLSFLWFINLFNFLDGIDGYASLEAIFVALGLFIITSNKLSLLLIFVTIGFLIWNWPKAKIFMGDVGSTQLGFIVFIMSLSLSNNNELQLFSWVILTSLFWMDATVTLFRRILRKEKISQPHKKHAYQRLIQGGFSHKKVDIISIVINLALISIAYASGRHQILIIPCLLLAIIINYVFIKVADKIYPFENDK
jgi:Fuc2NAc and GlcNAc transferase